MIKSNVFEFHLNSIKIKNKTKSDEQVKETSKVKQINNGEIKLKKFIISEDRTFKEEKNNRFTVSRKFIYFPTRNKSYVEVFLHSN